MPLKPRMLRSVPTPAPKPRPGMSAEHLRKVRQCPCLSCGADPAGTANHLLHTDHGPNGRGLGRKQADQWAVPACPACHQFVTDVGDDEAWYAERHIQARDVAMALWAIRAKEVAHYRAVIFAHRQRSDLAKRRRQIPGAEA